MAVRQEAQGKDLGPIIELEDGKRIIAKVMAVRSTHGEYEGHLIDLITMGGIPFSINGHSILCDKINSLMLREGQWFDIFRDGMTGRATAYEVFWIKATDDELMADLTEKLALTATEDYISAQIKALPPRD